MKRDYSQKTKPFEHQINAITKIEGDHPVALFDEMGLGKTKMVIAALCNDMKNKLIKKALIVCKKSLIQTWIDEVEKHSYVKAIGITGPISERRKFMITPVSFYIINYETLIQEKEIIVELLNVYPFAIVLDESHRIKNPDAKITKTLLSIRKQSIKNIIITGTPVANKPEDLWAQFYFLDGGMLFGQDFDKFKKAFGINISMGKSEINEENLKELQQLLVDFSIRRTKEVLTLPEKKYFIKQVKLEKRQREIYDKCKNDLIVEINREDNQAVIDNVENILKKMLRLTQIASNPRLLDKKYSGEPGKFRAIDELINEIIGKDEKVIIWTNFVDNVVELKNRYKEFGALTIYGKMDINSRNLAVKKFQTNDNYKVLIANPSAAKEGLTLTAANNAVYLDRTFSSVDYIQSQDRIHRLSQSKDCSIWLMIGEDTIDIYIDDILKKKHSISKFIHGDTNELEIPKSELTREYLIRILGG